MPIYEYKCLRCNNEFEAMQKFSDSAITQCPNCGGPVKKLISHSSFQLKGSGWYLTDYAHKNSPTESEHRESEHKSEPITTPVSSPASKNEKD